MIKDNDDACIYVGAKGVVESLRYNSKEADVSR